MPRNDIPEDNDLPEGLYVYTDDEIVNFPQTEDPGPPDHAQADEHRRQLEQEREHGHPALALRGE